MRSCPNRYCTIVRVVFAIVLIAVTVSSHLHFICHRFICLKSLFQGHVALWNFTLKGPQWFKLRSQQNRQIIALSHKHDTTYNTHCIYCQTIKKIVNCMFGEIIYHHALLRLSCRAILKLTSSLDILIILNLLTRSALALVTKHLFVFPGYKFE